jgi:hypothetical protein
MELLQKPSESTGFPGQGTSGEPTHREDGASADLALA